jgi:hypothetical protein
MIPDCSERELMESGFGLKIKYKRNSSYVFNHINSRAELTVGYKRWKQTCIVRKQQKLLL